MLSPIGHPIKGKDMIVTIVYVKETQRWTWMASRDGVIIGRGSDKEFSEAAAQARKAITKGDE